MSVKYRYMLEDDGNIILRVPSTNERTSFENVERYDFKSNSWSKKNIGVDLLIWAVNIDESVALRLINSEEKHY